MGGMNWHPCGLEKVKYIGSVWWGWSSCPLNGRETSSRPLKSWANPWCILSWPFPQWRSLTFDYFECCIRHTSFISSSWSLPEILISFMSYCDISLLMFCDPFWHCSTGHILDLTSMRNWPQQEEEHHRLWMERLRAWHGALHSPGSCGTTVRNRRESSVTDNRKFV